MKNPYWREENEASKTVNVEDNAFKRKLFWLYKFKKKTYVWERDVGKVGYFHFHQANVSQLSPRKNDFEEFFAWRKTNNQVNDQGQLKNLWPNN